MPKVFTSEKQKIGEIGENLATKFLMKQGFKILERNYTKKWGEIDIVAEKDKEIHFVEVKSISVNSLKNVTHETLDQYHPEDNMHPWKMKRMARALQTYLLQSNVPEDVDWQVDLIVVFLSLKDRKGKVKIIKDIVL